jgi:hypothetical protein
MNASGNYKKHVEMSDLLPDDSPAPKGSEDAVRNALRLAAKKGPHAS